MIPGTFGFVAVVMMTVVTVLVLMVMVILVVIVTAAGAMTVLLADGSLELCGMKNKLAILFGTIAITSLQLGKITIMQAETTGAIQVLKGSISILVRAKLHSPVVTKSFVSP